MTEFYSALQLHYEKFIRIYMDRWNNSSIIHPAFCLYGHNKTCWSKFLSGSDFKIPADWAMGNFSFLGFANFWTISSTTSILSQNKKAWSLDCARLNGCIYRLHFLHAIIQWPLTLLLRWCPSATNVAPASWIQHHFHFIISIKYLVLYQTSTIYCNKQEQPNTRIKK